MSLEIHVLVWDRHSNVAGFVCDTCKECFSYFVLELFADAAYIFCKMKEFVPSIHDH